MEEVSTPPKRRDGKMIMPLKTIITLAALSLSTQLIASEQSNPAAGAETNSEAKALF